MQTEVWTISIKMPISSTLFSNLSFISLFLSLFFFVFLIDYFYSDSFQIISFLFFFPQFQTSFLLSSFIHLFLFPFLPSVFFSHLSSNSFLFSLSDSSKCNWPKYGKWIYTGQQVMWISILYFHNIYILCTF